MTVTGPIFTELLLPWHHFVNNLYTRFHENAKIILLLIQIHRQMLRRTVESRFNVTVTFFYFLKNGWKGLQNFNITSQRQCVSFVRSSQLNLNLLLLFACYTDLYKMLTPVTWTQYYTSFSQKMQAFWNVMPSCWVCSSLMFQSILFPPSGSSSPSRTAATIRTAVLDRVYIVIWTGTGVTWSDVGECSSVCW